jgi:hypothetical protein
MAEGDTVYATGGYDAPKKVSFSSMGDNTLTIESQIFTPQYFSLLTGSAVENTGIRVHREVLVLDADLEVTATATPVPSTVFVYKDGDDNGMLLTLGTIAGTTIPVTDAAEGDSVIVYYMEQVTSGVRTLTVNSNDRVKEYYVVGETWFKGTDGVLYLATVQYFRVQPRKAFAMSFSNTGDPATISITCDLFADDNGKIMELTLIDPDE